MKITKLLITLVIALAVQTTTYLNAKSNKLDVGDQFPLAQLYSLAPLQNSMPSSLRGKVVVVDVWASWCNPCKKAFPFLNQVNNKYADKVAVIGLNPKERNMKKVRNFISDTQVGFPLIQDQSNSIVSMLPNKSMPNTYVIDQNGIIRFKHYGYHGKKTQEELNNNIQQLLN